MYRGGSDMMVETQSASSSVDVGAILLGQELHPVGKLALGQGLAHLLRGLAS
jgi:hypothetical protein